MKTALFNSNGNVVGYNVIDTTIFIPIECVHSNDSITYVYISRTKQQVVTGKSNENEIVIRAGLVDIDEIYLIAPEDAEDFRWTYLATAIVNKFIREDTKQAPAVKEDNDMNKGFKKGDFSKMKGGKDRPKGAGNVKQKK